MGRRDSDSGLTRRFRSSLMAVASKSLGCHSPLTMFGKQVSRPMDSPGPPSLPPRRSRSSELEEDLVTCPIRVLVPYRGTVNRTLLDPKQEPLRDG